MPPFLIEGRRSKWSFPCTTSFPARNDGVQVGGTRERGQYIARVCYGTWGPSIPAASPPAVRGNCAERHS